MKYRPEIDGLRAIAVLPVIFFHAGLAFPGGFVGVDIFFVISGYLITGIILSELRDGTFTIRGFYERRARRILPALFVVLAACTPFAWWTMRPDDFQAFGRGVIATILFLSNVLLWRETNYFAPEAELNPLLHTWSLAVEEQFYVLFPLLLVLLNRWPPRMKGLAIALLALASLTIAQWGSILGMSSNGLYYLLPSRAWELGAGALVAIGAPRLVHLRRGWAQIATLAGAMAMIGSMLFYTENTPYPSFWTLAPVLGAASVAAFASSETLIGRALAWRPLVAIGLVSYSAYLWHQPLFAFMQRRLYDRETPAWMQLTLIACDLLLAWATWRWIETPFRKRSVVKLPSLVAFSLAGAAALIGFGAVVLLQDGVPRRFPKSLVAIDAYASQHEMYSPYRETCAGRTPESACWHGPEDGERVQIWGDSHMIPLAWRLSESRAHLRVQEFTSPGCLPVPTDKAMDGSTHSCNTLRDSTLAYLESHDLDAPLIYGGRWAVMTSTTDFDNGEGGIELGFSSPWADDQYNLEMAQTVRTVLEALIAKGRKIVLVYPIPEVGWNVPNYLFWHRYYDKDSEQPISTSYHVQRARTAAANRMLDSVPDSPNLIRIRPMDLFCNSVVEGRCIAELDGIPLYWDDDHLNKYGADMVSEVIVRAMRDKGWLRSAR